jgi:hypothetical protein
VNAAVIAANTVTVENGVVVTIGGSTPANVYANVPNYSGRSGGNNSTSGTFAGAGAIVVAKCGYCQLPGVFTNSP